MVVPCGVPAPETSRSVSAGRSCRPRCPRHPRRAAAGAGRRITRARRRGESRERRFREARRHANRVSIGTSDGAVMAHAFRQRRVNGSALTPGSTIVTALHPCSRRSVSSRAGAGERVGLQVKTRSRPCNQCPARGGRRDAPCGNSAAMSWSCSGNSSSAIVQSRAPSEEAAVCVELSPCSAERRQRALALQGGSKRGPPTRREAHQIGLTRARVQVGARDAIHEDAPDATIWASDY